MLIDFEKIQYKEDEFEFNNWVIVQNEDTEVQVLLSLHAGKEFHLVMTSLRDFKMIRKIKLPFQARKMELHPNKF